MFNPRPRRACWLVRATDRWLPLHLFAKLPLLHQYTLLVWVLIEISMFCLGLWKKYIYICILYAIKCVICRSDVTYVVSDVDPNESISASQCPVHQGNKPWWNHKKKWMTLSSAAHLICGANSTTTIVTTPRPATSSSSSIAAPVCASRCLLPAGCRWSVGRQISWCQSRKWVHGVVRRGRRRRTHRERNHGIVVLLVVGVSLFPGPRIEYAIVQEH